jgi:hypothetical protein
VCGLFGVLVGFLYALTDRTPEIIPGPFPLDPCIPLTDVCIVLVFWQWKTDLILSLHFYIWYPGMEKCFFVFLIYVFPLG